MARYSPTVPIYQPGAEDVQSALGAALAAIEHRQDRQRQNRRLDLEGQAAAAEEARRAAEERRRQEEFEVEQYNAGVRQDVPRAPEPVVPPIFRGQRLNMGAGSSEVPSAFRGQTLGMGGAGATPRAPLLSDHLSQMAEAPGAGGAPRVRALPGQFVPGLGFTPHALFEGVSLQDPELTRPGPADPSRYARLPSGRFLDLQATPEARQAAAARAQRAEVREEEQTAREAERTALAAALARLPGMTPEAADALSRGVPLDIAQPAGPYGRGRSREQFFRDLEDELRLRARYSPSVLRDGRTGSGRNADRASDQATLDALDLINRFGDRGALQKLDELGRLDEYEQQVRAEILRLLATRGARQFMAPDRIRSPFDVPPLDLGGN